MKRWCMGLFLVVVLMVYAGCKEKETKKKAVPTKKSKSASVDKAKKKVEDERQAELAAKLVMPDPVGEPDLAFNVGDTVPDFTLKDPDGNQSTLYRLLEEKPKIYSIIVWVWPGIDSFGGQYVVKLTIIRTMITNTMYPFQLRNLLCLVRKNI